jgi:c-di-GMP-binding flagellar brake protein YcgR
MDMQIGDLSVRTKLQDVLGSGRFTVFHPTIKSVPIPLTKDDTIRFCFYRPNGVFSFEAKVKDWYIKEQIQLCELEATAEVQKHQRRKSYRLPIVLSVTLKRLDGDEEQQAKAYKAKTVDISEHGMLLSCFHCFPDGTPISAEVKMDNEKRVFKTEVLRCETPFKDTDPHNMVLLFLNCSEYDRAYLARFIMRQQIIARKKRGPGK